VIMTWRGDDVAGAEAVADFDMPQQMLEQAVRRSSSEIESGTRVLTIWWPAQCG